MAGVVNPPRGMRDFLPTDKEAREHVLATIRESYARFGYQEIETPVVEDLSRLASSDSGENEKLIFKILRRNLDQVTDPRDLADLGLRFDLTVPLARFYASHRSGLPDVFRSIQIGSVWRAERPQKGRFRQFTQCDLDVIGEPGILAEMELITATLGTLDTLGLTGCTVRLNDRRKLATMLDNCGFSGAAHGRVLVVVDKIDKIGLGGVERELRSADHPSETVTALLDRLKDPAAIADGPDEDIDAIAAAVRDVAGPQSVRIDPTLVRGMGYYTGPIFEIEHPDSSSSIAGGGRYDGMIGRFAGQDVPACGFSIGFERIVGLVTTTRGSGLPRTALVHPPDIDPARLLRLQHDLIATGRSVRLVRTAKRLGKLLDSLHQEGFTEFLPVTGETTAVDVTAIRPLS